MLDSVSRILNPSTNGVAIERANVYTYKTPNYSMNTAQAYHAGEYADQQAISSINLSNEVSIFTTQPAKIPRRSGTPTYWTGNGRQPYSVQEKNVNISIYNPPTKVGFMEPMIVENTTHVYFPTQLFDLIDETMLQDGYIFGVVGNAYIAIKSRYAMEFVPFSTSSIEGNVDDMLVRGSTGDIITEKYDLVQYGPEAHYFITECSSSLTETFEAFKTRILGNEFSFDEINNAITYTTVLDSDTLETTLNAIYDTSFSVNNVVQNLEYARYENNYVPFGTTFRKADTISYSFGGYTLSINYNTNTRIVGD
jgi:hypothetical protein